MSDPLRRRTRKMADIVAQRGKREAMYDLAKAAAREELKRVREMISRGEVVPVECPAAYPEGVQSYAVTKGHPGRRPKTRR